MLRSKINASLQSIVKGRGLNWLNDWRSPGNVTKGKSVIFPKRVSYDILIKKNHKVKKNLNETYMDEYIHDKIYTMHLQKKGLFLA